MKLFGGMAGKRGKPPPGQESRAGAAPAGKSSSAAATPPAPRQAAAAPPSGLQVSAPSFQPRTALPPQFQSPPRFGQLPPQFGGRPQFPPSSNKALRHSSNKALRHSSDKGRHISNKVRHPIGEDHGHHKVHVGTKSGQVCTC